jgi:hypothetical protein
MRCTFSLVDVFVEASGRSGCVARRTLPIIAAPFPAAASRLARGPPSDPPMTKIGYPRGDATALSRIQSYSGAHSAERHDDVFEWVTEIPSSHASSRHWSRRLVTSLFGIIICQDASSLSRTTLTLTRKYKQSHPDMDALPALFMPITFRGSTRRIMTPTEALALRCTPSRGFFVYRGSPLRTMQVPRSSGSVRRNDGHIMFT